MNDEGTENGGVIFGKNARHGSGPRKGAGVPGLSHWASKCRAEVAYLVNPFVPRRGRSPRS